MRERKRESERVGNSKGGATRDMRVYFYYCSQTRRKKKKEKKGEISPVRVCMQWRSNLSVSSSSMPVQPSTGESWMEMACRECLWAERGRDGIGKRATACFSRKKIDETEGVFFKNSPQASFAKEGGESWGSS